MGDLFFVIRMMIYTLILVVIFQVKVGPSTLEQKVQEFTHHSQIAGTLQGVAQGAATFMGIQYSKLAGQFNSKYFQKHSATQRPGDRLQNKFQELNETIHEKWEQEKDQEENP